MLKKLIDFTKNWKNRSLLHIAGGILIAFLPNLILGNLTGLIIGVWLCALVSHLKAKYSQGDILLTMLGGLIIGLIL